MDPQALDRRIRLAAFSFLERCMAQHTATQCRGRSWPKASSSSGRELLLTLTTVPVVEGKERPYDDIMNSDGCLADQRQDQLEAYDLHR